MTGTVTIISGPVGAGKSTVSRELVAISPEPLVYIEGDCFWKYMIKPGKIERRKRVGLTMGSMLAACIPYARGGYDVILDFTIPPSFIDKAHELLQKRKIAFNFVIIRPSLGLCKTRAASRAEGVITDYNEGLVQYYSSFENMQQYIIDDEEADARAIASRVKRGLDVGLFRI